MHLKKITLSFLIATTPFHVTCAMADSQTRLGILGFLGICYLLIDMARNPFRQSEICTLNLAKQPSSLLPEVIEQCKFGGIQAYQCKHNILQHVKEQLYCPKRKRYKKHKKSHKK